MSICDVYFWKKNDKEKAAQNAYRDSSYEQIGALSGFLVPFIYLKQKKYAAIHKWSTAILGGLAGFSLAANVGITKNEFKAIENGNFKFPDGSVRRAIINNYCIWNNKNYQHELKRLQSFDKAYKIHDNRKKIHHQSEKITRSYAELRENIYQAEYNNQKKDHELSSNEEDQAVIYEDEKAEIPEFNELLVPEIILYGEDDLETFSGEHITVRQVTDMYCEPVHQEPDKVDKVLEIEPRFQSYKDIRNSTVL